MSAKAEKVLIGVTGRMDSAVAAYLLKKQGFEVHAVAVLFHDQTVSETEEETLRIDKEIVQYGLSDLTKVKKVFDSLEIPFYAVNAQDQYYAFVHDQVVAHRLMGKAFNAKVAATNILFEILFQKAEVMKAKYVSTGHYAKLQKNQKSGESSLFSSPDLDSDQSFLLASLTSEQLGKLMLPLSDMRKTETVKIADIMTVPMEESIKHLNIFERTTLGEEIENFIPSSMIVEGEVILRHEDSIVVEHKGIHHFFLGQGAEHGLDLKKTGNERDLVVVEMNPKSGSVYVEEPKRLFFTHVGLTSCSFGGNSNSTFPIEVYVQFKEFGDRYVAKLYFKNNNTSVLEFSKQQQGLIPEGTSAVVYSKASGISRVLASGKVQDCFHMIKGHGRRFAPENTEDDEEIEQSLKNQMGF